MKYDDASWHYDADNFPDYLPKVTGATHTGMFVAWAFLSGLAGELHVEDSPDEISRLQDRTVTPGAFFYEICDGKFTDEDLNDVGNRFAESYFDFERGQYLKEYEALLGANLPDLYCVADTWENFDLLRPLLDKRFREWSDGHGSGSGD